MALGVPILKHIRVVGNLLETSREGKTASYNRINTVAILSLNNVSLTQDSLTRYITFSDILKQTVLIYLSKMYVYVLLFEETEVPH